MKNNNFDQKLEEFMNTQYTIKIGQYQDEDEVGFYGEIVEIPEVTVYEESISEILPSLEDAKKVWGYFAIEEGSKIPQPLKQSPLEEYSGRVTLRMPKSLHREVIEGAKKEGVSLNSHIVNTLYKGIYAESITKLCEEAAETIHQAINVPKFPLKKQTTHLSNTQMYKMPYAIKAFF